MNIAFCYESVLPARGGCETYISDLARRLVADRHEVHLYACRWDAAALPKELHFHQVPAVRGPRFLRPWRFGAACLKAQKQSKHEVTVGFDKTWGQDVLYPQGGLHVASAAHNLRKHSGSTSRFLAKAAKAVDLAHWSFSQLERRQYLSKPTPLIVANSHMVRLHFEHFYHLGSSDVRVVHNAIDPGRFLENDRPRRRLEWRSRWNLAPENTVGLFVAMNYRLKGLEPLLLAVRRLKDRGGLAKNFRLLVAGNPRTLGYERFAQKLGIADQVRFAGFCEQSSNCYFAADFLVHPTFYDPCSLVVLEALACGLPVITTRYNGASELLQPPREGYVISSPHAHGMLADCMAQLLEPARRAACAQAARKAGQQWTFEHHYRQMLKVFAEGAARKKAA